MTTARSAVATAEAGRDIALRCPDAAARRRYLCYLIIGWNSRSLMLVL
jgi:hypothetical protein